MKNFPDDLNVGNKSVDTPSVAQSIWKSDQLRHRKAPSFSTSTVAGTVANHAVVQPGSLALVDENCSLTYAQLNDHVDHFALELTELGVQRGDRVGLALEASVKTVALILGLHSIGATYVPLDVAQPSARLRGMVEDVRLTLVVSNGPPSPHFDGLPLKHLDIAVLCPGRDAPPHREEPFAEPSRRPDRNAEHHADHAQASGSPVERSTDTAYIIFTSGSTGRPKGVEVTYANLDALMQAWDQVMGSTRHTSLLLSALTFDASVVELFWPLHNGGTLVIAAKADAQPGCEGIGDLIRKHNIDHVQCTPTRATLLLSDPSDRAALAQLKHLVIGGEALTRSLAYRLLDSGIQRVTNAYGPTEATVWAFTHEVTNDLPSPTVGIGFSLDGISAAVVDAEGHDIDEIGVVGELVLGGPFVAKGYVNQVDLTHERFFSRAFTPQPSNGVGSPMTPNRSSRASTAPLHSYRTGDLVARNANGTLAFHGRSDDQVKIRGHRVELGEIEAALMTHPGVLQAVVCAYERNESNELVALVVSASPEVSLLRMAGPQSNDHNMAVTPLSALELRTYLSLMLPAALVPSRIVLVPNLPLTTSNKIDRVRVRNEIVASLVSEQAKQSDVTNNAVLMDADERNPNRGKSAGGVDAMIDDFRAVLGVGRNDDSQIHPDTDFFAAGGHSMFAIALLMRIEERTGVRLPVRVLLGAPTPLQLNALVQNEIASPVKHFDPLVRFRLSAAPRRLYLVHGAGGNVLRYRNLAGALHDVAEVIGVQAIGVEPGNTPDQTLTAMVDRYTAALLATTDEVFELGGYSDGGIIAIHIAHRLREAGKVVRSIILLDAFLPGRTVTGLRDQWSNTRLSFASKDTLSVAQWIRGSIVGWRKRSVWDVDGTTALQQMGYVDIYALNEQAVQREALPKPFAAPALVVRTFEETPTRRRNYDIGFDRAQASVAWVHGAHDELLKPASIPELELAVRVFLRKV